MTHVLWYAEDSHTSSAAMVYTWSLFWWPNYLPQMYCGYIYLPTTDVISTYRPQMYSVHMYQSSTDAAVSTGFYQFCITQQHLL